MKSLLFLASLLIAALKQFGRELGLPLFYNRPRPSIACTRILFENIQQRISSQIKLVGEISRIFPLHKILFGLFPITLAAQGIPVPGPPCPAGMTNTPTSGQILSANSNVNKCTWIANSGGGGSGTVTSVTTTGPITGGPITTTGSIACPTCGITGTGLNQFAATTSAQLAGIISDETGSGLSVFNNSPVFITPNLGTPSALDCTNCTNIPSTSAATPSTVVGRDSNASSDFGSVTLSGVNGPNLIASSNFTGWTVSGPIWLDTHAYSLDDIIVDSASHTQKVTTAGTSGGTIPTFNHAGSTTSDGSIVWTDMGIEWAVSAGTATHTPVVNITGNAAKIVSTIAGVITNNYYSWSTTVVSQSAGTSYLDLGVDCNSDCSNYFTAGANSGTFFSCCDSGTVAVEVQPSPDSTVIISAIQFNLFFYPLYISGNPLIFTQNQNTSFGSDLGKITSYGNVALGAQALVSNITGNQNTAIGEGSLSSITTCCNTAVGANTLNRAITVTSNVAIGFYAMRLMTGSGDSNIAIGREAMQYATGGNDNVALGKSTLDTVTTGSNNFIVGPNGASGLTTGNNNIGLMSSLQNLTTGSQNISIGGSSLGGVTTEIGNVSIGFESMQLGSGANNISIGTQSFFNNVGDNNIAIGRLAGSNRTTDNNALYIDSIGRSDATHDLSDSLIVGHMDGNPVYQTLKFNAVVSITQGNGAANTAACWKTGGIIGWATVIAGVLGTCN